MTAQLDIKLIDRKLFIDSHKSVRLFVSARTK